MKFYDKNGKTHQSVVKSIASNVFGTSKPNPLNPIRESTEANELPEISIPAGPPARLSILLSDDKKSVRVEDESGNIVTKANVDSRVVDTEHWNQLENDAAKLHSVKDDEYYKKLRDYIDKH